MLVLTTLSDSPLSQTTAFPDHLDECMLHYLPAGVALAESVAGEKQFFLLRYHGDFSEVAGGLLRLGLVFAPPAVEEVIAAEAAGWRLHPVSFQDGYFRIRLRSLIEGEDEQVGVWHYISPGREVVAASVNMTPYETQLLQSLLQTGTNVVEIEIHLRYQGMVPGTPWLVTADTAALKRALAAQLGTEFVRPDQVVAAFLSVPEGEIFRWRALEETTLEPTTESILTEVALRSLPIFFDQVPADSPLDVSHYRLHSAGVDDPPTFSWDLLTYRQEEQSHVVTWSVSELYQSLMDPEERQKYFPAVSQVSPFASVHLYVVNHLPFDPDYLQKVQVDLRFPSPTGVLEYQSAVFTGETDVARFTATYPAVSMSFRLEYRITCTLAPKDGAGWPIIWKRDFAAADGVVVEVSQETADIHFIRIEAEAHLFEKATSIGVELFAAGGTASEDDEEPPAIPLGRLALTAEKTDAWVALPGIDRATDIHVRCLAYSPIGQDLPPYTLFNGPVTREGVKIAAYWLEVLDPDLITVTLDAEVAARFAYVGVALASATAPETDEGRLYSLQPGEPRVWPCFRSSVFEPVRFRYRIHYVAYNTSGQTLPMAVTAWMLAEGRVLTVRPPFVTGEELA